jgi:hypothetical protein
VTAGLASGAAPAAAGAQKSPPASLPLRHFVAAALAFWIFGAVLALTPERFLGFGFDAMWALGTVHTLTLGWITMTIFGVLTQLTTVLWEVPLTGRRCATAGWWLFVTGLISFVGLLWAHLEPYWVPASLLVAAVGCYLYAFLRTMVRAPRLDWTGKHLVLSTAYLSLLVVLGLLLAWDRQRAILFGDPQGVLIAHVHLALVGWVSMTILGVSYRLVSMFALSHERAKLGGWIALGLINFGLLGLVVDSLWLNHRHLSLWAWIMAAGYASYLVQMRRIFKARARKFDPSLSFTVLALIGGAVWAALGVGLTMGWLPDTTETRAAYLFAALLGWATPFILGQITKIVPFLVWLEVYSPAKSKRLGPPPMMQALASVPAAWAALAALTPGIYLGIAGFLFESTGFLRASGCLILAAATLHIANLAKTLRHLWRPN